jgi:hypothetical protein
MCIDKTKKISSEHKINTIGKRQVSYFSFKKAI